MLKSTSVPSPIPSPTPTPTRQASLFRNGRNQAVRIPRELELPGSQVLVHKEGDRLILTPIRPNKLLDLLASWQPLDADLAEVLTDRVDLPLQAREPL
jgi:antitoxin VapB